MMTTEEGRAALLEGRPPLNVVPKGVLGLQRNCAIICIHPHRGVGGPGTPLHTAIQTRGP